jgi:mannose-6-phosphate isomerase-like protein (cupin superfamily)
MNETPRSPLLDLEAPEEWGEGMHVSLVDLAAHRASGSVPFKASRFTVAPGCTTPLDRHDVREMWMIASGRGRLRHCGSEVAVDAGRILFFESEEPHEVTNEGPDELVVFSIWWPR